MSDALTHVAVLDDCRRLAQLADGVDPVFMRTLESERSYAILGTITHRSGRWSTPNLRHARDRWDNEALHPELDRKVAFALGGVIHGACDQFMKPLRDRSVRADTASDHPLPDARRWVQAYHDAHLFKHVFLDGAEAPFNRFMLADNPTAPGQALEAFVRVLFLRSMLSQHTIEHTHQRETDANGERFVTATVDARPGPNEWVDNVLFAFRPLYVDVGRLVEAHRHPDPILMERYGIETAFYNDRDPVIRTARALQRGECVTPEDARAALAASTNASAYGRALCLGIEYLGRASDFWRDEVSRSCAPPVFDPAARDGRRCGGADRLSTDRTIGV